MAPLYSVYIIKRKSKRTGKGSFYTGSTDDPAKRWKRHKAGYTKANKGYHLEGLAVVMTVDSRGQAMKLEKMVKKWPPVTKKRAFAAVKMSVKNYYTGA